MSVRHSTLATHLTHPHMRARAQVSNRETENLRFTRLCYDRGMEVSGVRPILLPAFFFAGQIQKVSAAGHVRPHRAPSHQLRRPDPAPAPLAMPCVRTCRWWTLAW